jgi:hypothetical protein
VFFEEGRVVHAVYGNIMGESAFHQFIMNPSGRFEFTPGPLDHDCARTINASSTALIMEGARLLDDGLNRISSPLTTKLITAASEPPSAIRPLELSHTSSRPPDGLDIYPPLVADTILAAQYELAIRDPFALGELRLFSSSELARWTQVSGGRDRLHVHLVSDLSAGVSAILALGGAPTERWVLRSLSDGPKTLGLTFFFRHERALDVVLVDARDPASYTKHLMRSPGFVILAPPDGDLMTLGTKAHVALEGYLERLDPLAILGVGNAALDKSIRSLAAVADRSPAVRCAEVILGDGGGTSDLRDLLTKGIRLWSTTAEQRAQRPTRSPRRPAVVLTDIPTVRPRS